MFVNSLVGAHVGAVSHVAHTTRGAMEGVVNIDDTQIVLTDTPGIVSHEYARRLNMDRLMVRAPRRSVHGGTNVVAVLVDAADKKCKTNIDACLLDVLRENESVPSVLVMNKVDLVHHKVDLLRSVEFLTSDRQRDEYGYQQHGGWSKFDKVFMVSSKTGDGLSDVLKYLLQRAKPAPWVYRGNIHTNMSIEQQIHEVVRGTILTTFAQEIPWHMNQDTTFCELRGDGVHIHHRLIWPRASQQRYVQLEHKRLSEQISRSLESILEQTVHLTLDICCQGKRVVRKDEIKYY